MVALLTILAAGVALRTHGLFAWSVLLALIMLIGYALVSSSASLSGLKVHLELPEMNLFSGEGATATLRISNASLIPVLWLYMRQDLPRNLEAEGDLEGSRVISLAGGESRKFSFRVGSLRRGTYHFGSLVMESGDLFGLTRERKEVAHGRSIVVYPRVHDLRFATPSRLPFGRPNSPRTLTEDPNWVRGIRDYQAGDPLSRIHWRATGHAGYLQTKELEPAVTIDCAVVVNLDRSSYSARFADPLIELAIETAASMTAELLRRRCSLTMLTNLEAMPRVSGRSAHDLPRFLGTLAGIDAVTGCRPLSTVARAAAADLPLGAIVYIVTPSIDDELVSACYALVSLGRSPVLLHTVPRDRIPSRMARLGRGPIVYVRVQRGLSPLDIELLAASRSGGSQEVM